MELNRNRFEALCKLVSLFCCVSLYVSVKGQSISNRTSGPIFDEVAEKVGLNFRHYNGIHYSLAMAYRGLRDPEKFQATLRIDPQNATAHYNLALLLARDKRHEQAILLCKLFRISTQTISLLDFFWFRNS